MVVQKFLVADQKAEKIKRSLATARFFEKTFKKIGGSVAGRPYTYIFVTTLIAVLCAFGFAYFRLEAMPHNLWLPADSDFVEALKWEGNNFKASFRRQVALLEGDNVLHPTYLKELNRIYKVVADMEAYDDEGNAYKLKDVCLNVPQMGRIKENWMIKSLSYLTSSEGGKPIDWSLLLDQETYCTIYEAIPKSCLTVSMLEMWDITDELLDSLTEQDIINAINTVTYSPTFGFPFDFTRTVGGITRNETGHIVAAKSTMAFWMTEVNKTSKSYKKIISAGLTDEVDEGLYRWESKFIPTVVNDTGRPKEVKAFAQAKISFENLNKQAFKRDFILLMIGTVILYIYVIMMLGKFNLVEARSMLSLLGFISIYVSILGAFGLCSALGIIFTPLHTFLPLILLGLGVDDMFVLIRTWENMMTEESFAKRSLKYRLAETLKKSGVAIFITSLTDCVAFSIGSLTCLPALNSFCLYSAIGVAFLFISQVTVFFACFVLDQKRLEDHRNGIVFCIKYANWTPNPCSQISIIELGFEKLSKFLMKPIVKLSTLILTACMSGICIWGVINLRQEFNLFWYFPHSSHLYKFSIRAFEYYPEVGSFGEVILDNQAMTSDLQKLGLISAQLQNHSSIYDVESFHTDLVKYAYDATELDISNKSINETTSSAILGRFLFSTTGGQYFRFFSFDGTPKCGEVAPSVNAVKVRFIHKRLPDREARIKAMDEIKHIVRSANFSGFAEATGPSYSGWESDKIVVQELVQNLLFSLAAVFVMCTLLLANIKASFLVFICVLITLIEVMALMTWWGLTVDVITCVNLVLCIGLSVDYSAHIALHFMKAVGTKTQRAQISLVEIGPAVINGAFSTFLAFALLVNSDSHFFLSFFKVFFGVFIFGLYQGMIFLPVVLSIIGPNSYNLADEQPTIEEELFEVKK